MPKAPLVTRATTSGTNTENLNKASALTHAEMDKNLIGLRDASWGLADDSSTVLQVTNDKTITIAGGTGIGTALSGDTLTITGNVGTVTATSSDTFTNKTLDANGTGNSITNIDIDNMTAAVIVTAAETIGSNNNDTTIPTSAAVKAYADSVGGGTITALNNQAENRLTTIGSTTTELDGEANLTFDGTTLAITGAMTATTSIANDAVSINDNKITTTRSNDDLALEANGTGQVQIRANGGDFANFSTDSRYTGANTIYYEDLALTPGAGTRHYRNTIASKYVLTGSDSSNSNDRFRNLSTVDFDMNGVSSTATSTYRSRGPTAHDAVVTVRNNGGSAATLGNATASINGWEAYVGDQDLTITAVTGMTTWLDAYGQGSGDLTIGDAMGFNSVGWYQEQVTGTTSLGTFYHYYAANNNSDPTGKTYSFYAEDKTDLMQLSTLESYRESINALTSSSTITVDCSLAPFHTVTLGTNTEFNISSLGTGQTVTVKIIQDGTGSRLATFGTDGSTAVKFAGGTPTLSTAASSIDVVTIFNDGTDYIGSIAKAFAA